MNGTWVHAGRYDICLEDVSVVKRLGDGRVRVYVRGVSHFSLDTREAGLFLPQWDRHLDLGHDVGSGAEGVGGVVEDAGTAIRGVDAIERSAARPRRRPRRTGDETR